MKKRILALLLALMMVFSLCACGGGTEDQAQSSTSDGGGDAAAPAVESVSLNSTSATLEPGETLTLACSVSPEDAEAPEIQWASSDDGVATVDGNGQVTAVGPGSATVTASVGEVSATCAVTVNKPKVKALESFTVETSYSQPATYTAGGNLTLDEFGRVAQIKTYYKTITFFYDDENRLTEIKEDNDGEKGGQTMTYENGVPTVCDYRPSGWRSDNLAQISATLDGDGRVVEMVRNEKLTDKEDKSVTKQVIKETYQYGADGQVSSMEYYAKNKKDHTTYISYDADGDFTVFSFVGTSEYLRISFTYTMVDGDSVTETETDSFTGVYNWLSSLNFII